MPADRARRWAALLLWITPALWSSNYVIARAAGGFITPHVLALGRWSFALLLMLPAVWPHRGAIVQAWRAEWRQMVVLGALGMWICGAFVYQGALTTGALNIGLMYAVTPIGIAVAGRYLLHEPVSALQRIAMVSALLGVLVVMTQGDLRHLLAVRFVAGDLWVAAAALAWTGYSVLLQRWPSALAPRERLACIIVGGLLVLLPFTLAEVVKVPQPDFSWRALLLIALAGLVPGFLSYQAYGVLIKTLGVTRSAVVMYMSPLYAAGLAWVLLGEAPAWYHALGAVLILPSIHLATRPARGS